MPNGIYLECKGLWEPEDRRKIKAVIEQHPEIDLRMVFQAPFNKISKKSKTTYANGAIKHNIKWCSYANIPLRMAHLNSRIMMPVLTVGPVMVLQSTQMSTLIVSYVTHGLQEMVHHPKHNKTTMNYAGSATA